MIYDELLDKYIDDDGKIVDGKPEFETYSFEKGGNAVDIIPEPDTSVIDAEKIVAIENAIKNFKNQIKMLEESKKNVTNKILQTMQKNNVWSIKVGDATITRVKESERHQIDSERLRAEMPEIAQMYDKAVYVSESLRIKIGGTKNEND